MKSKKSVVFTNGCFDIIHAGHIHLLRQAKRMGTKLIVGLNSDRSITELKGPLRPINNESDRFTILSSIRYVDKVIIFDQLTPLALIMKTNPNILVKGSDYDITNTVGADYVLSNGGEVKFLDLFPNKSTSRIVEKIVQKYE